MGVHQGAVGINQGVFGVHKGSVRGAFIRSLLVTKFGELIWTALQIETWCHHPINFIVTILGFDISLRLQESTGSQSIVFWESDSNQIWRADMESSSNLES